MLSRVERSIKQCARFHIDKFMTLSSKRESASVDEESIKGRCYRPIH